MKRQNVMKWCREFSEGRTDVHDEQRSGRPILISYDLLQETEGEIRANRHVTIRELNHIIPEVSKTTIHEAVTENLGYKKLCACWVPKNLMITKQNRWVPHWSFSRATHRKGMSFWTPLWLEMKNGIFKTLLNPSKSLLWCHMHSPKTKTKKKIKHFNFSEKNHGSCFLWQKRHSPGWLHASWCNN